MYLPDSEEIYAAKLFAIHGDRFRQYQWVSPHLRKALHNDRRRGGKKYHMISHGDWIGPLRLTTVHRKICILYASGVLNRYICRRLNYSESRLSIILSSSLARLYIAQLKERFTSATLLRRIRRWGFDMQSIWGAW